jgi:hypothetical protein
MKQQRKKRSNKQYYWYIGIFLLAWFIIDYYQSPLETRRIETSFIYDENKTGFDLTPGSLRFGKITEGQSAQRNINITNPYSYPITIEITSHGETKKGLRTKEQKLLLQPKEEKIIAFTMVATGYQEYKEYKGEIHLTIRKA